MPCKQPTYTPKVRGHGAPHADAAHAEPLPHGQLHVEQRKTLHHQGDQVGDQEGPWRENQLLAPGDRPSCYQETEPAVSSWGQTQLLPGDRTSCNQETEPAVTRRQNQLLAPGDRPSCYQETEPAVSSWGQTQLLPGDRTSCNQETEPAVTRRQNQLLPGDRASCELLGTEPAVTRRQNQLLPGERTSCDLLVCETPGTQTD